MSVVMVGGLDGYLIKVAQGLVRRGVSVTHLLDRYQRSESRQGVLAAVESVDARQFMVPEEIISLNVGEALVVDADMLAQFAEAEFTWLSVTDRYTHTLNVAARRRLFRELLEYFYRWLPANTISTIVFPNVPHAGWNNVLYSVAQHFGIDTIILEPTRLADRVMLWSDYEHVEKVPTDFLAGASAELVRHHIDSDILQNLSADSSWMTLSDEINRDSLRTAGLVGDLVSLVRALATGLVKKSRPRDLVFDEPWSWWQAHWRRFKLRRRARRMRALYESLATTTIPDSPYILFFLNYQPEKSTTPMGGVFDDQLLAARLLAQALPVGWKLLVKEHPRQFGAHVDAAPFRSPAYYRELAGLPNTQLVSSATSTASLLSECAVTATITGSIGWQGLLAGKPALNFGRSWYGACRSCYIVRSHADVRAALQEISRTSASVVELDVLKFLAFARSEFIVGGNADQYVARSKFSVEQLADSLADALARRIAHKVVEYAHSPGRAE